MSLAVASVRRRAGLAGQLDSGGVAEGGDPFHGGEFLVGGGQACVKPFDLAEPALLVGFGQAGGEVIDDLGETARLGRIGAKHGAADAGVLVLTRGRPVPVVGVCPERRVVTR